MEQRGNNWRKLTKPYTITIFDANGDTIPHAVHGAYINTEPDAGPPKTSGLDPRTTSELPRELQQMNINFNLTISVDEKQFTKLLNLITESKKEIMATQEEVLAEIDALKADGVANAAANAAAFTQIQTTLTTAEATIEAIFDQLNQPAPDLEVIKTGLTQARAELAAAQSATVAQLAATQAAADVVAVDN